MARRARYDLAFYGFEAQGLSDWQNVANGIPARTLTENVEVEALNDVQFHHGNKNGAPTPTRTGISAFAGLRSVS